MTDEAAISWDEYGMLQAKAASLKSKDPSTKVGCYLASARNRPISIGYNGFAQGVNDSFYRLETRPIKLAFTIHAEANAIIFAQQSLEGATAYVWPLPPCAGCAALLCQCGVRRVVTIQPTSEQATRWGEDWNWARIMYEEVGVKLDYISEVPYV